MRGRFVFLGCVWAGRIVFFLQISEKIAFAKVKQIHAIIPIHKDITKINCAWAFWLFLYGGLYCKGAKSKILYNNKKSKTA
ncbi:hypothetical protein CCZ01_03270 [Helicobacter monodelphidis]|uniref:hypothetical protein n=1 Tax=Helicobacter sp. 15-1451 TaxID=2004995 RepID=UPI000DCCE2F1|nr:hypothetical protein [Helicobacter sp. 15-1451]RAX58451.1 hypothetical protein CCZ01_03270 [Helicobacter sp. 15-1451]